MSTRAASLVPCGSMRTMAEAELDALGMGDGLSSAPTLRLSSSPKSPRPRGLVVSRCALLLWLALGGAQGARDPFGSREGDVTSLRGAARSAAPPVAGGLRCSAGAERHAKAASAAAGATRAQRQLTWILVARNDNYLSKYNHPIARLCATLAALFRGLSSHVLAADSEVILVDWNSPTPLLSDPRVAGMVRGRAWTWA